MRLGAVFPHTEIGTDPGAIRSYAQQAEEIGCSEFVAYDHVVGAGLATRPDFAGPFTVHQAFHEVMVLFGFLAAVTERALLTTGVLVLPQRQTALVARQAAEVDVLSGGRVRLGVGVGWNHVEFEALGAPFALRGRQIEEQIEVLRALWENETVDFSGTYHRIPDAGLNPLPVQRPIPILIGVSKLELFERVARVADGWMPFSTDAGEVAAQLVELRRLRAEGPRSDQPLPVHARVILREHSRDTWVDVIRAWATSGVDSLSVGTTGLGLESPDDHVRVLSEIYRIAADVDG
ncbi:MAG: LLM class F420-dependent oxidoreductase [Acidimicrobiia bacterium]